MSFGNSLNKLRKSFMQLHWMRWIGLATLCIGGSLHAGAIENLFSSWWKAEKVVPPAVNLLIVHDRPGVVLEVKGKYKLFDPRLNSYISTRFVGKRKFVQPLTDGLKWGEEFPGVHQIKIVPDDAKATTLVDGVEYKGVVLVYDIGGTISVVNEVPLEDYLRATLVPQFDKKLHPELAAALAIAARTNTWYQVTHSSNPYWALEASKVGYQGYAAGASGNGITGGIEETRGMVLTKEGAVFPIEWEQASRNFPKIPNAVPARISFGEAENLAKKGDHAAQILEQTFPGSAISMIEKTP